MQRANGRNDGGGAAGKGFLQGAIVAGSHQGGYSRARIDVTEHVHPGKNTLVMRVDSRELEDIPPFGHVIDYLTFGGIYRDVTVYFLEAAYVTDLFFRYTMAGEDSAVCTPELWVKNEAEAFEGVLRCTVRDGEGRIVAQVEEPCHVPEGKAVLTLQQTTLEGLQRWDVDSPVLYTVTAELLREGQVLDVHTTRVGFRTMLCAPDGFYLNGRKVTLVGINRHQS